MKINEKNLVSFAMARTPIDREGWLLKRGDVNKSFQRRLFVLKGNLLFYFEKGVKEPAGVIILEGCTIELAENEELFAFKLIFHGAGNRTYVLCADSQENMEGWMKALACASYDYMKLMVAELQRQLDEITELEKQAKSSIPSRLRAGGGLPLNHSDSCLWTHASSSKMPRFNPFDKVKYDGEPQENMLIAPSGLNPMEGGVPTLSSDGILPQDLVSSSQGNKQRRTFRELHEYYGQIFRRVYEEHQKKQTEAMNGEPLIDLG